MTSAIWFRDDLQVDRIQEYGHSGEVEWEPGQFHLGPQSSLWPRVTTGRSLELNVMLTFAQVDAKSPLSATEFHVPLSDTSAVSARLETEWDADQAKGTILIRFWERGDNGMRPKTLREFQTSAPLPSGPWSLRYHFGLLQVLYRDEVLAAGYVEHVRNVGGILYRQEAGRLGIGRMSLIAEARKTDDFSLEQKQLLEQSARALQRCRELFRDNAVESVAEHADAALKGFTALYGVEHPHTLRAKQYLGTSLSTLGNDPEEGRRLLHEVLDSATRLYGAEHPQTAEVWIALAGARLIAGDDAGALRAYERGLEILAETEGRTTQRFGTMCVQAGAAADQAGQPERAFGHFRRGLDVLREVCGADHPTTADVEREYATTLIRADRRSEAQPFLEQALRTYEQHGAPIDVLSTLMRLAELASAERRWIDAEKLYSRALEVSGALPGYREWTQATLMILLGTVAAERGEIARSVQLTSDATKLIAGKYGDDDPRTAMVRSALAAAHHIAGDYELALNTQAACLETQVRYATQLLVAVSESEAIEAVQDLYGQRDSYVSMARRVETVEPLEVYRRVSSVSSLVSRLNDEARRGLRRDAAGRKQLEQLSNVRRQLSALAQTTAAELSTESIAAGLAQLSERKENLERELRLQSSSSTNEPLKGWNVEEFIARLPENTAVIHFLRSTVLDNGGLRYDAFILRRGRDEKSNIAWLDLGSAGDIDAAVRLWRENMSRRGHDVANGESPEETLQRLVWSPLQDHLQNCEHLIIVPDGSLERLPWGALPTGGNGELLIRQCSVSVVTYVQQLDRWLSSQPEERIEPDQLLLVGGVEYGPSSAKTVDPPSVAAKPSQRPDWTSLPGTLPEIEQIAKLWGTNRAATTLTSTAATERAVLAQLPRCSYVHLATHGYFDASDIEASMQNSVPNGRQWSPLQFAPPIRARIRNPMTLAGIVLAGANTFSPSADQESKDDGLLSAEDVASLDLSGMRLVVLSACETGLGDNRGGEGVFSVHRAFEQAGAETSVASLWPVSDHATQTLMTEFYTNLWDKKLPKLEALRQAQLTMLNGYNPKKLTLTRGEIKKLAPPKPTDPKPTESGQPHHCPPYYWAGFVMSGDWR